MSELSYMDKLLDGVKVEWKLLDEVGKFQRGKRFVKKDMISEGFPCIHYGEMYTHYDIWANTSKSFVDKDLASKLRVAEYGDVVIVAAGETIEDIGRGTAWLGESSVVIHDACFSYKSPLNPKYVSYFLRTKIFQDQIKPYISSGKISAINAKGLGKAKIPIPPLNVQTEIVQILDKFTELTAELTKELTKELTARQQQYLYYRDELLTFEEGEVKWKELRDLTLSTSNIKWSDTDSVYRYIDLSSVNRENNKITETTEITAENAPSRAKKLVEKDDVIFATTRPTQQRICLIDDKYSGEIVSTGYCVLRAKPSVVLPKWIYFHLSSSNFKTYLEDVQSGSAYPAVSDAKVKRFKIPIPPLAEQKRIVSILDKFEALTISLTEGLPREIELREKQYEYYRELLLNFPKLEGNA